MSIREDYEAAYLIGNGRPCFLKRLPDETWMVMEDGKPTTGIRYTDSKILEMTARLEKRNHNTEPGND